MKNILKWFVDNWGSFFSFLGVIFTIYFGVLYVPNHLKEAAKEKELAIHNDILQTTKELIYSDSISQISEISNLIKGKEIKYKIEYKYDLNQLLLQTQEAFMEHKFLPLSKRKELISEVDALKETIPKESINKPNQGNSNSSLPTLLGLLSIVGSITASMAALYSLLKKKQIELAKSKEIENSVLKEKTEKRESSNKALEYEEQIIKVISDKLDNNSQQFKPNPNSSIDYMYVHNDVKNYVYIKHLTKSKIGLGSIRKFFQELEGRSGNALVIFNTGVTEMVINEVNNFHKRNNGKMNVKFINVLDVKEFENIFTP